MEELLNRSAVSRISELVEKDMHLLNKISAFKEMDEKYFNTIEDFENNLSETARQKFNAIIKLEYKINDYYFALAFILGAKAGNNYKNI